MEKPVIESESSGHELDYLRLALEMYLNRSSQCAENKFMSAMWRSWAVGAYAFLTHNAFTLRPDSFAKAELLLELGIQAMISLWFWKWYSQREHSEEVKIDAVSVALTNVQTFLDIGSDENIELYLGFDREFQCIMEKNKLPICYVDMFSQRYRECITGDQVVRWPQLQFPIESQRTLIEACDKSKRINFNDPTVHLGVWSVITLEAGKVMFEEFTRLSN